MCGLIGIVSKGRNVIEDGIVLLNAENNRGEQACGAAVFNGKKINYHHGEGRVAEVFGPRDQKKWSCLLGSSCIMQTLYSTIGRGGEEKQPQMFQPIPFVFHGQQGALAHNGNLVGIELLREETQKLGYVYKSEVSDSEVIAGLISTSKKTNFFEALQEALLKIENKGAFSLVVLFGEKIVGIRDPYGIRPLCIIKKNGKNSDNDSYILASESGVYPALDATRFIREVNQGEMVVIGPNGIEASYSWAKKAKSGFCICEFIYFANPASRFFGVSAYAFRVKAGEMSAIFHPVKADFIVPVPESGRGYSDGFSSGSGIPAREGLIKNRYSLRTFMDKREVSRGSKQRTKLQANPDVMDGKNVCLVEDSIFRASVAPAAVKMSREHGRAKQVHLRVCSPPSCHRCFLGLDTSTNQELVASYLSTEEIRGKIIHADSLEYLTMIELRETLAELGLPANKFCFGCFTGEYPISAPL